MNNSDHRQLSIVRAYGSRWAHLATGVLFALTGCSSDPESQLGILGSPGMATSAAPVMTTAPAVTSAAPQPTSTFTPGGPPMACPSFGVAEDGVSPAIMAAPANNYTFTSTLTLETQTVKPGADLLFDWSGVTTDFIQHPMNPAADTEMVLLVLWPFTREVLQDKMNTDALTSNDPTIPLMFYPMSGATSANLLTGTLSGNPVEPEYIMAFFDAAAYPPEDFTYSVMLQSSTEPAKKIRMIKTFKLDPNSQETTVAVSNTSTGLAYDAILNQLTPTPFPIGTKGASLQMAWGDLTVNAMQRTIQPRNISDIFIAHYDHTLAELKEQFLFLNDIAVQRWDGHIEAGTDIVMSELVDSQGAAFPGITTENAGGTWLMGLSSGASSNPAPWYLTVVQPCTAP